MSRKKHILVVSQYFHPEQFRINDICEEWVRRGYKVTVLTGIPNYPQGKYYDGYGLKKRRRETWKGIEIIRIPLVARGHNPIGLSLNYLSFPISGWFWKVFTKIKADVVFNYETSPMTQGLIAVWYAKKHNIPCYIYVTDLWPDNVEIVTGIHNKQFLGAINKMVNYIYKRTDRLFTSSQSFIDKMIERDVPKEKLTFWPQYAEEFYRPYQSNADEDIYQMTGIPNDGILNVVFAGNIGYAQGLGILPKAAKVLKKEGTKIRFNVIGDGRYMPKLLGGIKEADVAEYFNMIDRQPAKKIPFYMAAGDVAMICLSKSEVFAITIPAKTQSCMACAMPMLVSADGEVRDIIEDANCGLTGSAEDVNELVTNLKEYSSYDKAQLAALGENSLAYYKKYYERTMLLNKMDKYLEER